MGDLKSEVKHEFEGNTYIPVPIKTKRQDGFEQSLSIYIEEHGNSMIAVNKDNDVVLKIIGDGLTVIPVD